MISQRYRKQAGIYKQFAQGYDVDFSERALEEMFNYESKGIGKIGIGVFVDKTINGYFLGKQRMDLQIAMWKESLPDRVTKKFPYPTLWLWELYEEGQYPHWWLDKIFRSYPPKWKQRQNG